MNIYELEILQPAPLAHAGQEVIRRSQALTTGAENARQLTTWEQEWSGIASAAATHRAQAGINPIDILGMTAHGVGGVFFAHGKLLEAICAVVRGSLTLARHSGMLVAADGTVTPGTAAAIPGINAWAASTATALSAVLHGALKFAQAADTAATGAIRIAMSGIGDVPRVGGVGFSGASEIEKVEAREEQNPFGKVRTYGNLEAADKVITLVSGVGSSGEESQAKTDLWARQKVAEAQAEGKKVAVVTWHGYPAPGKITEAVSPSAATVAAEDFRDFQRELRERAPKAELHVVGYSYGSTVVGLAGKASQGGLEADRMTLWGSPGAGVRKAEEIGLMRRGSPLKENSEVEQGLGQDSPQTVAHLNSERVPGDRIGLATTPLGGPLGPDPTAPPFNSSSWYSSSSLFGSTPSLSSSPSLSASSSSNQPENNSSGAGWGEYLWRELTDMYLWSRGETDSHSSYLWDPVVNARL